MKIEHRQKFALKHPCERARDALKYPKLAQWYAGSWITTLVVCKCPTFFDGKPAWHATASLYDHQSKSLRNVETIRPDQIGFAIHKLIRQLLQDVGQGVAVTFVTDPLGTAVHGRKELSPSEIRKLPEGFIDTPVVDDLGPVREISARKFFKKRT